MNMILFEADEVEVPLAKADPRGAHVLKVLRREAGDEFDVGLIDGPKGKATLVEIGAEVLTLSFVWGEDEPALYPIDLIVGLSRPQTNRKILGEATTLGVSSIRFITTNRGEPSYAESKLWTSGEWRRHLVAGAAQAFSTRLPKVRFGISLEEALADVGQGGYSAKVALDNYEATERLGAALGGMGREGLALVVGSERGWTGAERNLLRDNEYTLAGLGERVLRTETAVVAAVAIAVSRMG